MEERSGRQRYLLSLPLIEGGGAGTSALSLNEREEPLKTAPSSHKEGG